MTEHYQELSSRAARGEKDALRELFALADQCKSEGKLDEASEAFRDSAIAYRISAFHNLNRAESLEKQFEWQTSVSKIYLRWIECNPNGLRKLPFPSIDATTEDIIQIVIELFRDTSFYDLFRYLEMELGSLGMHFFSPGGSIQRRVCGLLNEAFGIQDSECADYLESLRVRIGLDLLADEVSERLQSRK